MMLFLALAQVQIEIMELTLVLRVLDGELYLLLRELLIPLTKMKSRTLQSFQKLNNVLQYQLKVYYASFAGKTQ
jgi:hypothetical protein